MIYLRKFGRGYLNLEYAPKMGGMGFTIHLGTKKKYPSFWGKKKPEPGWKDGGFGLGKLGSISWDMYL